MYRVKNSKDLFIVGVAMLWLGMIMNAITNLPEFVICMNILLLFVFIEIEEVEDKK